MCKKEAKTYLPIFKCILKKDPTKEIVETCLKESKQKMTMDEVNKCVQVINLLNYLLSFLRKYIFFTSKPISKITSIEKIANRL